MIYAIQTWDRNWTYNQRCSKPAAKSLYYCRWWHLGYMAQVFGDDDIEADKITYQVLFSAWFDYGTELYDH